VAIAIRGLDLGITQEVSERLRLLDSAPMSDEVKTPEREDEERRLEVEMLERREAALAHVVKFGDPV
jgi:hypothetical protein